MPSQLNRPKASAFRQYPISWLRDLQRLAEKGIAGFLLALGALVILLTCSTKLTLPWVHTQSAAIPSAEFIALLLVGTVILLSGAVFGFYTYRLDLQFSTKDDNESRADPDVQSTPPATSQQLE